MNIAVLHILSFVLNFQVFVDPLFQNSEWVLVQLSDYPGVLMSGEPPTGKLCAN